MRGSRLAPNVVHDGLEAALLHHVGRHAGAHDPEPDESDFHGGLLLLRVEDVRCDPRRRHGGGPAGIEGEMRDKLTDLVLGDAVTERAFDVSLELIAAAHGGEHGYRDETGRAWRGRGAPTRHRRALSRSGR